MKINCISNINNKNFTAKYDAGTSSLLKAASSVFDNLACDTPADTLVINDGKDLGIVKSAENKKVCLSKFAGDSITLQVADKNNEVVEVYYHNPHDTFADKYCKYKDQKIFPWFAGRDEKLFSKRIVNMNKIEYENVKQLLTKYIPVFLR